VEKEKIPEREERRNEGSSRKRKRTDAQHHRHWDPPIVGDSVPRRYKSDARESNRTEKSATVANGRAKDCDATRGVGPPELSSSRDALKPSPLYQ